MTMSSLELIIGMRFVPKDEELLLLLNDRYTYGNRIPPELNVIIDESVYKTEPWNLKSN